MQLHIERFNDTITMIKLVISLHFKNKNKQIKETVSTNIKFKQPIRNIPDFIISKSIEKKEAIAFRL